MTQLLSIPGRETSWNDYRDRATAPSRFRIDCEKVGSLPMKQNISPLIAAMLRPEFYPQIPSEVKFRQTHISYVFLAGPYVYKVTKAVRLPFLDYSTLEKRRHFYVW